VTFTFSACRKLATPRAVEQRAHFPCTGFAAEHLRYFRLHFREPTRHHLPSLGRRATYAPQAGDALAGGGMLPFGYRTVPVFLRMFTIEQSGDRGIPSASNRMSCILVGLLPPFILSKLAAFSSSMALYSTF